MACARSVSVGLLAVIAALLSVQPAEGVTWNLTTFVAAPDTLVPVIGPVPVAGEPCTNPGWCAPYTFTLPPQTAWYWCGFKSTYQTVYTAKSAAGGANITGQLMRQSDLFGCAIPKPSNIKNCLPLDVSVCDAKPSCNVRVVGLVFYNTMCLVIANNDIKGLSANVSVTVVNSQQQARVVGTVFTGIISVSFCLGLIVYFTFSCYREFKRPTHRIDDLLALENKLARAKVGDISSDEDAHSGFREKFAGLKRRINALVHRTPAPAAA